MKKANQLKFSMLMVGFIAISSVMAFSKVNNERVASKFLILIETTKDGIKLTGEEGCIWEELSFKVNQDNPRAINQYGMTSLSGDQSEKSKDPSSFHFQIIKTKSGIKLESINGTAWTKLSFSCPNGKCYQYIDSNGMTNKN